MATLFKCFQLSLIKSVLCILHQREKVLHFPLKHFNISSSTVTILTLIHIEFKNWIEVTLEANIFKVKLRSLNTGLFTGPFRVKTAQGDTECLYSTQWISIV